MLNIMKQKNQREEEEKKKIEEEEKATGVIVGKKKAPGEIRLKKEILELDLPTHAKVLFPDETNIMKFEVKVDLTREDCLWKGANYKFTVNVPHNYPHEPPKCHCDT